jgi:type IV pilus assembly protein PilB
MLDTQQLFAAAIQQHASDIHIEPYAKHTRIRLRQDGILVEYALLSPDDATRLTAQIKLLAHLNIAEKRLPQDGRIKLSKPSPVDIRINTCPTIYGEKMVLRLQNHSVNDLSLSTLGLNIAQEKYVKEKLSEPQGLILATGPTGSGKTKTLDAALHYLNTNDKNISTVEDPVEIILPNINQINIHPAIGLDFAACLRSLLRQDPDIIMIGEIRDAETARIAMHAAQTGHLVLSTLHCQHAEEALLRLQSLGITSEQLTTSLSLILSQRLIRKLSANGYSGRTGIFELATPIANQLPLKCYDPVNTNLKQAVQEKIASHITDKKEMIRTLGASYCNA